MSSSATSTPRPPVCSRMSFTGSSVRASIGMAPSRLARSSLRLNIDREDCACAQRFRDLNSRDAQSANSKDRHGFAGFHRALFNACSDVADERIMIAPCSKGISSGNLKTLRAGMTMNSPYPPSRDFPIIAPAWRNCSFRFAHQLAVAARGQVVQANALADAQRFHILADLLRRRLRLHVRA